jgi:hypothetical protein
VTPEPMAGDAEESLSKAALRFAFDEVLRDTLLHLECPDDRATVSRTVNDLFIYVFERQPEEAAARRALRDMAEDLRRMEGNLARTAGTMREEVTSALIRAVAGRLGEVAAEVEWELEGSPDPEEEPAHEPAAE